MNDHHETTHAGVRLISPWPWVPDHPVCYWYAILHKHDKISIRALKEIEMPGENHLTWTRSVVEVEGRHPDMTPLRCQSNLCSHGTAPSFTTPVSDAPVKRIQSVWFGTSAGKSTWLRNVPTSWGISVLCSIPRYRHPFWHLPSTERNGDMSDEDLCQPTEVEIALRTFKCGVGKKALDSLWAHRPKLPLSDNS